MNEGSYFGFYDEFGNLNTVEWRAPGLTVVLDTVAVMNPPATAALELSNIWGNFKLAINETGDLVVTATSGPNAGKSVNLTAGKWT